MSWVKIAAGRRHVVVAWRSDDGRLMPHVVLADGEPVEEGTDEWVTWARNAVRSTS